jgi:hypothetical protein
VPYCVSPEAVKTDIQGIKADLGKLKTIDDISLLKDDIDAEEINYSGAGWVVTGTCGIALIFAVVGIVLLRAFIRRGNMLILLTYTIREIGLDSPEFVEKLKKQLRIEASTTVERHFDEQDRKNLGKFAIKKGTFAKRKRV